MIWVKEELRYYVQHSPFRPDRVELWLGLATWQGECSLACYVEFKVPGSYPSVMARKLRQGMAIATFTTLKSSFAQSGLLVHNHLIANPVLTGAFEIRFADSSNKAWPDIAADDLERIRQEGGQFGLVGFQREIRDLSRKSQESVVWA